MITFYSNCYIIPKLAYFNTNGAKMAVFLDKMALMFKTTVLVPIIEGITKKR
jgi:hypothetical protein